jgi:uncharacterized membrane protein YdjX (TVP38/TMEM64 family)
VRRSTAVKILIAAAVLAVIAGFRFLGLGEYFSLDFIKESRAGFEAYYAHHRVLVPAAFFCIYVAVTAFSLPGAAVMTLAAGALFGFWVGLVMVSFASSVGATLACLVARFLLRDWVQGSFGRRLRKINEGVEQEGSFYLFTLRLIPIFPFWAINLAMGLTGMALWRFYWVSQVGMLPGTVVYVNAGKQLGELTSLSGIFSPDIVLSLVLLGLFPLAAKKLVGYYRKKKGKPPVRTG